MKKRPLKPVEIVILIAMLIMCITWFGFIVTLVIDIIDGLFITKCGIMGLKDFYITSGHWKYAITFCISFVIALISEFVL